ncbi:FAD-binding protein [Luteolibacter sp. GHJ8]|uniref:FAD-binding protein n=1 Tax=Luteolibacter rhizosphaerae TaxID=2989719 RepID=A0ABT3FZV8_9BACT|nr:FAD-linked oxidase C-terminal domain-containing protein [Luteolibacter rhizosphaerae]MCW1913123.1 FAD-binding protein [Luteolibacter rhizosphaerae]
MNLPPKRSSWISRTGSTKGEKNAQGSANEEEVFSDLDSPQAVPPKPDGPTLPAYQAPSRSSANTGADSSIEKIAAELTSLLGPGKVSIRPADLEAHAADKWYARQLPDIVVFAESTQDVSKTLRFASKLSIPVTTRGAGYGYVGGCVPVEGGIALSVARMKKIIELNPADGVAVVQPGVITGDLQQAAHAVGWDYPPDPASLKDCSIGGNVATNAGGPRCLKYGVTRHYVLGLEVVLADGRVLRCGGRVHKNKTGFDLCGLFTGSEGMLGVVTEVTLRLIPKPPARAMLAAVFPDFPAAAAAVQRILNRGHLPSALEITDGFTLAAARRKLGPDSLPEGQAHLMVEVDGRPVAVESESAELDTLLHELGATRVDRATTEQQCEALWQLRREFSFSLRDTGLTKLNEDIVVPRSALVDLVDFARRMEEDTGIPVACFGHAGDGNIHVNLMVANFDDPPVREKAEHALDQLFAWILDHGGAITGEHGVGIAKKPWIKQALGEVSFDVHLALKDALDPQGLLNPGKFLD